MSSATRKVPYGGLAPEHWKVAPLKYIATLTNGYVFNSADREDAGTPILRIENLNGSDVFNHSGLKLDKKHHVSRGDLLFSWSGNPGTSFGPFRWTRLGTYYLNQHIFKVSVSGCERDWLYWSLKAATYRIERELISGMIGMVHVTKDDLGGVPIPIPPPGEQRRIADFLDIETARIDRMQAATKRQISLLSSRLNEEIRLATTVGKGISQQTGIAWMPGMNSSWTLRKVSHEFRSGSGTTPKSNNAQYFDGPFPWINSSDVNNGEIVQASKMVSKSALSEFPALQIHPAGSLVIALYGQGATKGKVGILRIDACMNQACCALAPIGSILPEYALYWFRSHKNGIVSLAMGAGQPNLSQELIRQLRIPTPNLNEQRHIVAELRDLEDATRVKSDLLRTRERLLTERRHALIIAATTGQFDVYSASGRGVTE